MLSRSLAFCSLFALALMSGCTKSPPAPASPDASAGGTAAPESAAPKSYRIAVIPKGTTHVFWKSVHAGALKAAREAGNVEILWDGAQLETDTAGQISIVQGFVTAQADGIVLAPGDSQALVRYVEEARDAKIPVVIFDSGLDGPPENYVSYVATDNYQAGALAGRRMGEVLGGKGDVILLRYVVGSESTHQREQGFLETIEKEFPDVNILSSNEYSGGTPESSLDKAMQVLNAHKDEVDGMFAVCEPNAMGTLGALKELGLAGKVKFIAFDPSEELIEGVRNGNVDGIVLQDPVKMGYEGVRTMLAHLRGEKVEPRVDTGVGIATKENMETPEMTLLLNPEQAEK